MLVEPVAPAARRSDGIGRILFSLVGLCSNVLRRLPLRPLFSARLPPGYNGGCAVGSGDRFLDSQP
jgi:hypothetical protein